MPKDSRIKFKIGKTEWHAGILRKELPEDERKNLAIGVSWGQDGFEKAIELRLSTLHQRPFLRLNVIVGPKPTPPPPPPSPRRVQELFNEARIVEWIEKVEEARERPADCSSVVGVDRPYDWRRG